MTTIKARACSKAAVLALLGSAGGASCAVEMHTGGRISFGAAYRLEDPAPHLLVSYNAAAMGLTGLAMAGQNSDDANNNFRQGDATTRALHGFVELSATEGALTGLLRIKAWHDFALRNDDRPWGNNINGYAEGAPLGDAGAPRLGRFSGVALSDYYLAYNLPVGATQLFTRIGQQTLPWGERAGFGGGVGALNALDAPAYRRAGSVPQEFRAPAPMLYARLGAGSGIGIDAFYQTRVQPNVAELCGTFWAVTDYMAEGCNRTFSGAIPLSDRARLQSGSFLKRTVAPYAGAHQFGAALTWKLDAPDTNLGLYYARYTSRSPVPGLRKSTRTGPGLVPNDPDDKNLAFFTEYVGGIDVMALSVDQRRAHSVFFGELTLRPRQPVPLPAGDVLPAFLNPAAPSLMRTDADAVAPGALFHAYDTYRTSQLQAGVQHDWPRFGGVAISTLAEFVVKHAHGLPDPARRRYGRADQYGGGPVNGVCTVGSVDAARQCSVDGFVTPTALAYRLRIDGRFALPVNGWMGQAWALLTHDARGWSYDFQINEGRRVMNTGLRFDYRQRYFVEMSYMPVWGGIYNAQVDRDQLALAVGTRF